MTNAKHTPGPLIAKRGRNGDIGILTATGDVVAECYPNIRRYDEGAHEEAFANGCLYAAASELLALAEQYASECGECSGTGIVPQQMHEAHDSEVNDHGRFEPCPDCESIRVVIAKARP